MDVGNEIVTKHEDIEEFQITIDDHQVFHPGEKITGVVKLSSTKVLHPRRLFVKISGQAYVKWTELNHLETTEFVNCENYLNDSRVLLECKVNNNEYETLLPGSNEFPFCFAIPPSHLPSSFFHGWHKKDYAFIRYWISACISLTDKDEITVTQDFYIKETADLSGTLCLQEPRIVSAEEYIAWCCFRTGPVTMKMEVNQSAYHPGQDIVITARIDNVLSSFNTGKVDVQLVQRISYSANCDYTGETLNDSLQRDHWSTERNLLLSASVAARREINWDNVHLRIPRAIVPTISSSKCIQVAYFVQLRVSFRVPEDCVIRIPIVIVCKPRSPAKEEQVDSGDESSRTQDTDLESNAVKSLTRNTATPVIS